MAWKKTMKRKAKQPTAERADRDQIKLKIKHVPIDEIVVLKRRPINPKKLKHLKSSIERLGLRTPLTVRRIKRRHGMGFKVQIELVAGLHRLEACKLLDYETVPVVYIKGGRVIARMWEISENLHRADLTSIEEADQTAEFLKLLKEHPGIFGQIVQKTGRRGRPRGGLSDDVRHLPIKGSTEAAKRKNVGRLLVISRMTSEVKKAAEKAGLARNPSKLHEIASEKTAAKQLAKIDAIQAKRSGGRGKKSNQSEGIRANFEIAKSEWQKAKKLRGAWSKCWPRQKKRFVSEVMRYAG